MRDDNVLVEAIRNIEHLAGRFFEMSLSTQTINDKPSIVVLTEAIKKTSEMLSDIARDLGNYLKEEKSNDRAD